MMVYDLDDGSYMSSFTHELLQPVYIDKSKPTSVIRIHNQHYQSHLHSRCGRIFISRKHWEIVNSELGSQHKKRNTTPLTTMKLLAFPPTNRVHPVNNPPLISKSYYYPPTMKTETSLFIDKAPPCSIVESFWPNIPHHSSYCMVFRASIPIKMIVVQTSMHHHNSVL